MSYVFDANSILLLTRNLGAAVLDVVKGNLTSSLAYHKVGNAVWKERSLLGRLSGAEATMMLEFVFSLLGRMKIVSVDDSSLGVKVLRNAEKLSITYYDSVYLTLAEEFTGVLVTDDGRLADASTGTAVKTLTSKSFVQK